MFNSSGSAPTDPPQLIHLVTAVYLGLMAGMGLVGNVFVLAAVVRVQQMQHLNYILVSNVSVIGLLNCVVTIPAHVTHMLVGSGAWEGENQAACKVLAHFNFGLMLCTLINSAAIAVCRYRTVTSKHRVRHQTLSTGGRVKLIAFIWALPTLVALSASPFLGFNALLSDCFFVDVRHAFWYMNLALAVPAFFSALCMFTAYSLIVKKVRDSHIKVSNLGHKPFSLTDNAALESREDRTVSEAEHRKDTMARHLQHPGPFSNVRTIRIFTTMIPDIHIPSTSYGHDKDAPAPGLDDDCPKTEGVASPGAESSNQGSWFYLQPLQTPSQLPDESVMAVSSGRGMDTLPVPCRTPSGMSQDTCFTRQGSVFSASSSSSTCSVVQNEASSRGKRRVRKEVKLTVHLFLAFALFCLLYLPLCFAHLVHAFHSLASEAWLVFYTLAMSFASNAWLVYALLNKDFRRAFRALLQGQRSF